jgi:uncharacterized protein YutD
MKIYKFLIICLILPSFLFASHNNEKKIENLEKSMAKKENVMDKFDFLLGDWSLEYRVPKSAFSEAATGSGTGTFKRALDDKYVFFDYSCTLSSALDKIVKAHAIFAWDEKAKVYRYWWFESSGSFQNATCNFVNDDTLFLNWHDTLFIQTFRKASRNKVILRMEHPTSDPATPEDTPAARGKYGLVLEVIFTRQ